MKMIFNQCFAVITGISLLWNVPLASANPPGSSIQGDGTTGTQVLSNSQQQIYEISGGTQIDQNLLHSFLNFSVENGWTAAFRPLAPNITNIIGRITGSNVSNIDGLLQVDRVGHPVNLFLINPNGIVFGPGAKLDLSGSFVATTADSVKFSEGYVFSAKNTALPSTTLLTLGVPVGLQFGSAPAPIIGNFTEPGSGLNVEDGQTLALVGGNINLQGSDQDLPNLSGFLFAPNGRVEVGSVGASTTVGIVNMNNSEGVALDFSGTQRFQDVFINALLVLGQTGTYLYGRQIQVTQSQIGGYSTSEGGKSSVTIKASGRLDLLNSSITSGTFSSTPAGTIDIQAETLQLSAGSSILADTFDISEEFNTMPSQAGNINIKAGQIVLTDESSISSRAFTLAPSQGGNISLETNALVLRNQSNITTSSRRSSSNGGNITINAGIIAAVPSEDSNISTDAVFGNGGNISITTQGLFGIGPNTANFPNSSDITARSEFGLNGTIDTNIISTNSVVDLAALPAVLGTKILKTACFGTRRGIDRDSFIYSGRGGLPTTPSDPDQNMAIWQDFRTVPSLLSQGNRQQTSIPTTVSQSIPTAPPIVEAQGFSFKPDGSVQLVAAQTISPPSSQTCASAYPTSPSSQASTSGS
jgi:filamentous hemagglutinin family protein